MPLDTMNGEQLSNIIGYTGMGLVLTLPLIVIALVFQNSDKLK